MAQKLKDSIPAGLDIDQDYKVLFTAIDATTGAVVTSVKVSKASLLVAQLSGDAPGSLASGPFMLVPGPQA